MTKTIEQTVNEAAEVASSAAKSAAERAAADAASRVAEAAASSGSTQAGVGVGARYASGGAEVTSDTGQAEWYIAHSQRVARNAEDYDQALRSLAIQAAANAQGLANRQNEGAQSTTERINSIQENSLMFDNEGPLLAAIRNPVFLDAIAAKVVEVINTK